MKINKFKVFISLIFVAFVAVLAQLFCFVSTNAQAETQTGTPFVIEKNEIKSITLFTYDSLQLKVGSSASLNVKAMPKEANLTLEKISYRIVIGKDFAQIKNNKLKILDTAKIGATVEVMAIVDGVESENILKFVVVETPMEQIQIQNTTTTLMQGEKVTLQTKCLPLDATNKSLCYEVVDGADYVKVLLDGTLCVDSNLPSGDLTATVRVSSLSDASIYDEKTFNLYKPVQSISSFNRNLRQVEQQREYNLSAMAEPRTATKADQAIIYSLDVPNSIASISDNGTLKISATAQIGTKIKIRMDAADGVFFEQTVEVVKVYATSFAVTNITRPTHGEKYLPGDTIIVQADFLSPFNVTEENKVYEVEVSDQTLASVSGHTIQISDNINVQNPHFVVRVFTNQNGKILSESIEIDIYIPVDKIEVLQNQTTLKESQTYQLNDLLTTKILPDNSEIKDVQFKLVDTDYAWVVGNKLIVNNDLPSGDLKISLYVTADEVCSDIFEFDLYKPIQDIQLENADLKEVEQQREYSFCANVYPFNATFGDKPVVYSIDVDQSVATINQDGLLKISATAPIGTKITIRIDATDGVFHEQTVEVVQVFATSFAVTSITPPTHGNKYLPGDEIEFVGEFLSPFNITESNKVYEVEVSDPTLATVCGHVVKIKNIEDITMTNPQFVVRVFTNQNGTILSETFNISIYIPVVSVEIQQKVTMLVENESYKISELIDVEILPHNSENKKVEFILSRTDNAVLSGNTLIVKDDLSAGDLEIELKACVGGIESSHVTFDLYKPIREIVVSNGDLKEVEQQREYMLTSYVAPSTATMANKPVVYSIDVDQSVATINQDGLLKISATAPIGTKITIRIDATDGVFHEQTVEVVQVFATSFAVTSITPPTHGNKYLPGDEIEFVGEFLSPFNITESNKVYEVEVSDPTLATVCGHIVKIKNIEDITMTNPQFVVRVFTNQNGTILSETFNISLYIPVVSVEVVQTKTTLVENKEYSFSNLFSAQILPQNSEVRNYEVELLTNYATLSDGKLKVHDNLPCGNIEISIRLKADSIYSKTLTFEVYKPLRYINLVADNTNPISATTYGEGVNLSVSGSETASVINPIITVQKGADLIEGNYKNGDILGMSFFVKKNLSQQKDLDKQITIQASQDGITKVIDIFVYIPNEQIVIAVNNLVRGNNNYSISHTQNADDTRWTVVSKPACVTTMEMGKIYIDPKTTAGTKIKIVYKSSDRLATQFETEFVVEKIDQIQSEVVFTSSGAVCDSSKFNVVVDKDSENVFVTSECRQLYVGRSTIIQIKYKGLSLDEYGLQVGNVTTSENATLTKLDGNCIQLLLSENALGNSSINFGVQIIDGNETYDLNFEEILKVFRPMSGTPRFGRITNMSGQIPIVDGGDFDQTATYGLNDLKYAGDNSNNSTITQSGNLTLVAEKSSLTQWFTISCEQNYNNTTELYQQKVSVELKHVRLNNGEGESSLDNWVLIDGFHDKLPVPTCTGYIFHGYYNQSYSVITTIDYSDDKKIVDAEGTILSISNVTAASAVWYPITYYVVSRTFMDGTQQSVGDITTFRYNTRVDISANAENCEFKYFEIKGVQYTDNPHTLYQLTETDGETVYVDAYFETNSCVASGTLMTLADGTQKAVEELDGSESLLVWNLLTGKFDSAPILFIESHGERTYKILNLQFEDGTNVEVISEHGFWNYDQSKYVYLDYENAKDFVGNHFDKQYIDEFGELQHKSVELVGFEIYEKFTNSWSPVTYGHLCYYVNGMLSVPSETQGFTNIFDVDPSSMQIDAEKMKADIEMFGLFDYDSDFKDMLPKTIYDAFCGDYLKVAIAKENLTMEQIEKLIKKYSKFFGEEGV